MAKSVNITISVPIELKAEMDELKEINWSEVVRGMLSERVTRLSLLKKMDKMLENSKLTEEDAVVIGRKIKRGIAKRMGI